MKLFILGIIFIFTLMHTNVSHAEVQFAPNAQSAILIEASTNTILYEKNKNESLRIASMTKIMTLIIAYDAISDGKIRLDDKLVTSEYAKSMTGTRVFLDTGDHTLVEDLIKCIAIASANDAAVTLAEGVAGTEEAYVGMMNKKALELGMKNTHFSDATGLSDDNHYSSAYDMAIASSYLINKYPDILTYTSMQESYFRENTDNPFWLVNTNKLVGRYDGVDGLKTGWTTLAGYCMSLTATNDNMRLIAVVIKEPSAIIRNQEAIELIKYGFSNYKLETFMKGEEIVYQSSSIFYRNGKITYILKDNFSYVILKNDHDDYKVQIVKQNEGAKVQLIFKNKLVLEQEAIIGKTEKRGFFELWYSILKKIYV